MFTTPATVALLTDFGLSDHYVGTLKAVLLSELPHLQIVDLNHTIPAQQIQAAAFDLMASYAYFAKGTLFLVVVDPGVGSKRRIIYMEAGGWRFVGPDNGVLSWISRKERSELIVDISHAPGLAAPTGRTFHGRDIMAPLSARILKGEDPARLGPKISEIVQLPFPEVQKMRSLWMGEVLAVDHFGNIITNFSSGEVVPLARRSKIWFEFKRKKETVRGLVASYADAPKGRLFAIEGSAGFIEIAVKNGSAFKKTLSGTGSPIKLHLRSSE